MSNKGIYTALSGAMAQAQRMDTIANNIANVNTAGFKKDKQTFYEYLTAAEKRPDVIQVDRVPASISSFYNMQGADRGFVDSSGTYTDFTQGTLKKTGNKLDLALSGKKAMFEVLTGSGVRYTRNGSFMIDSLGRLVTKQGHPVLRQGQGQPPQQRIIQITSGNIVFSDEGDVFENNEPMTRLSIVEAQNADALGKVGGNMFRQKPNMQAGFVDAEAYRVQQGYIESSNVNVIQEMTDMIQASRTFESTQKIIKSFDLINGQMVNQLGKTNL